jgi:hypothetical protein
VDELELFDGGRPWWQEVTVLDETGRADKVHRELDAAGLERMFIRQVVLHQVVAVNEHHGTWHGHLP